MKDSGLGSFLAGVLIGGLIGAAVGLLLAPEAGERLRGRWVSSSDRVVRRSTRRSARGAPPRSSRRPRCSVHAERSLPGHRRAPPPDSRPAPFDADGSRSPPALGVSGTDAVPSGSRYSRAVPALLRGAWPHARAAGTSSRARRPDPALRQLGHGAVQTSAHRRGARDYTRAVDAQPCLRVAGKHNDFEEVGRTPRHHTLFEMLGNWSFGDYFKREAIDWAWEFVTMSWGFRRSGSGHDLHRRRGGPRDLARRDRPASRADGRMGRCRQRRRPQLLADGRDRAVRSVQRAPLRPRGATCPEGPQCVPDHSEHCPRWLEFWNLVFMEFDRAADGTLTPLPFKSVDTGMGLERISSVIQGVDSDYKTDLFTPVIDRLAAHLGHDPADRSSPSASATRSSPTTRAR